jgi:hypothetical protein
MIVGGQGQGAAKNSFLAFGALFSEIGSVEIRLLALLSVGITQIQLLVFRDSVP